MKLKLLILTLFLSTVLFGQFRNQFGKTLVEGGANYNFISQNDSTLLQNYHLLTSARINFNKIKENEFSSYVGLGITYLDWQESYTDAMENLGFLVYVGISDEIDWSFSPKITYLPKLKRLITSARSEFTPFDNIFNIFNLDIAFNLEGGLIHNLQNRSSSPTFFVGFGISAHYYLNYDFGKTTIPDTR